MSDLKKMTLTVKNYNLKAGCDLDALYDQVTKSVRDAGCQSRKIIRFRG